ncbi:FIG00922380: hypothetical protein [hydrothermal vent metagenome]|uniref:DUF3010 domain-containing protein n=1 Tax=hydrothermal vent metagenome TaxID=652676 RepID=A0A3B0Z248_9ZZZZ
MKICGVNLTEYDANICLLDSENRRFTIPDCRVRKLTLPKDHSREDLQKFQFTFAKLMEDYKVTKVAISERMRNGKFAGSAISFKLESAIQLIADMNIEVVVLSPAQIKSALKESSMPISFRDTELKKFQESALTVAYAAHIIK